MPEQDRSKLLVRPWLYFGCKDEIGHYLFTEDCRKYYTNPLSNLLSRFDGILAPFNATPNIYCRSELQGLGYTALSWWDNSVDKRSGSNSTIFCPTSHETSEDILIVAEIKFPWVFKRLHTHLERMI